ncbi:MAG: hypothetical protein JXR40_13950 [Pontiellaceae bacterium]|nr:hypothetical protein [Pontiellaceae bacterium]
MKYVLALLLLSIPAALYCEGLRTFTDKTGRTVKAKIVKVDKPSKKVTVELENKKTATVEIDIFSEDDQNYIQSWVPSPLDKKEPQKGNEKKPADSPLSKEQIEIVVQKYEKLCIDGMHDRLPGDELLELMNMWTGNTKELFMYFKLYDDGEEIFIADSVKGNFLNYKQIRIDKFVDNGALLEIKSTEGEKEIGYILITNDGRIKYDSAMRPHPIETAYDTFDRIIYHVQRENDGIGSTAFNNDSYTFVYKELVPTKIPLFGLSLDQKSHERQKSIDEIKEWLIKNGAKWDNSEPKLFLPEDYITDVIEPREWSLMK